jgi:hypothetical protein
MRTMILAAAATLTFGLGSACADSLGGVPANTFFTQLPGVTAKPVTGSAPTATTTQTSNGRPVQLYPSQSSPARGCIDPRRSRRGIRFCFD